MDHNIRILKREKYISTVKKQPSKTKTPRFSALQTLSPKKKKGKLKKGSPSPGQAPQGAAVVRSGTSIQTGTKEKARS